MMRTTDRGHAAELRASMYRARRDRPSQRRNSDLPGARANATFSAQIRAGVYDGMQPSGGYWSGDDGGGFAVGDTYFTGLASSVNSPYEMFDAAGPYQELVAPGAFQQSLSMGSALDVPLVLQHDDLRRIARTTIPVGKPGHLALAETQLGLACRAQLDPGDPDVAYILPKMQSGLVSEMSFRFVIDSGEWSPDFAQYVIHSANLQRGDVSICGYGANPNTMAMVTQRAAEKYSDDDRKKLAKKGKAMPDGSYPITDKEDLEKAIQAVGRGSADHDSIRKHIMDQAKKLGLMSLIPTNWAKDGSLRSALLPMSEREERALLAQLSSKYSTAPRTFLVRDEDLR